MARTRPRHSRVLLALALLISVGGLSSCTAEPVGEGSADVEVEPSPDAGQDSPDAAVEVADGGATDGALSDAGESDAGQLDAAVDAGSPRIFPFQYQRSDVGTPVSAAELTAVTDLYLDLLERLGYFKLIDLRAHGWPESAVTAPWYATWWSGVVVQRSGGKVTYLHPTDSSDNNGLRTAPMMEGACYAWRLWRHPTHELLLRRLMRGNSSWVLAMHRWPSDLDVLQARAAYPPPVTDLARGIFIDYSPDRPGIDGVTGEFVHIPANPLWGDIWIRSKRSKDDIPYMQRAISQVDTCATLFSDAGGRVDFELMRTLHQAWAARVAADGLRIATLNKSLAVTYPTDQFTWYNETAECDEVLALRLMAAGTPSTTNCGDGSRPPEITPGPNSSAMQIVRSAHEASSNLALLNGQDALARDLLGGLAKRTDLLIKAYLLGMAPSNITPQDFAELLIHSVNTGLPLTSREVRWLHDRIREAHTTYLDGRNAGTLAAQEPGAPDGTYAFEPTGAGLHFNDIGALLGSCAAQFRNPDTRPVLDCARVASRPPSW